jgi:uncharacterized protein (DUF697 family)
MNKKRLPRAVLRTAEEMRGAAAAGAAATSGNVITMTPKPETANVASASDSAIALRRRKAVAIVERYANGSAIGGAIPVPLVNATAITALMVRMVKSLSDLYGVPFERNRTRSIIVGLMGGALPTGFATIATSTLSYFVPGLNLVGLAVASVTSGAYARSIGQLYIEHFESGAAVDFRSLIRR